mmetsp:Transcript_60952/g.158162  ORF Transcript_60952/g.158162 Transcript_60952/m.158162 type:complete len:251 (+) Transcript_60952:1106-1858(+)
MFSSPKATPWTWRPRKKVTAALLRAWSSSSGFRFHDWSRSSGRPARSTSSRCTRNSSSAIGPSCSAGSSPSWWSPAPLSLARFSRPSSSTSEGALDFAMVSLRAPSFPTTLSSSRVSCPKPRLASVSSWSSSSSSRPSSSTFAATSVTDLKIMDATLRTASSSFSTGSSTMVDTALESTRENPIINPMMKTSNKTLIPESTWFGLWKLNEQTRTAFSYLRMLPALTGMPRDDSQRFTATAEALSGFRSSL